MKRVVEILAILGKEGRPSQKSLQLMDGNDRVHNVFVASKIAEMMIEDLKLGLNAMGNWSHPLGVRDEG